MTGTNESMGSQVALISGGGRGIGRAIALAFAERGARVAIGARSLSQVEAVAEECRVRGGDGRALQLDVADRGSCENAVARVEREWGPIGILVNNAGIAISSKFLDLDDATWESVLTTNLTGAFYLTRAALPAMLAQHNGAVITISSLLGKVGAAYVAPYAAAKHGLIGLMRSLAAEYPRSGVTFNCVCPAYVDTPMTAESVERIVSKTARTPEEVMRVMLTPQGRLVAPEEVAAVCLLLASREGRGINGQAINVDGGQLQS